MLKVKIEHANPYKMRDESRELLKSILDEASKRLNYPADTASLAARIELGVQNFAINKLEVGRKIMQADANSVFKLIYSERLYNIAVNLDPDSRLNQNEHTQLYLASGVFMYDMVAACPRLTHVRKYLDMFKAEHMAKYTASSLVPWHNRAIIQDIEERSRVVEEVAFSIMYKCSKCKENKCTIKRKQTRSSDEGYSYFATCNKCGNYWGV